MSPSLFIPLEVCSHVFHIVFQNDLNTAETALDEALTNYHEAQAHIEQLMNKEKTDAAVGTDMYVYFISI